MLVLGDLFLLDKKLYSDLLYERLQLAWNNGLHLRTTLDERSKEAKFQVQ